MKAAVLSEGRPADDQGKTLFQKLSVSTSVAGERGLLKTRFFSPVICYPFLQSFRFGVTEVLDVFISA